MSEQLGGFNPTEQTGANDASIAVTVNAPKARTLREIFSNIDPNLTKKISPEDYNALTAEHGFTEVTVSETFPTGQGKSETKEKKAKISRNPINTNEIHGQWDRFSHKKLGLY